MQTPLIASCVKLALPGKGRRSGPERVGYLSHTISGRVLETEMLGSTNIRKDQESKLLMIGIESESQ